MTWYVEFEVESYDAEKRFWDCCHRIGETAEKFKQSGNWTDLFDLEEAAFDFAREMGYNV